jgi:hypothetical protein
MAEAVGLTEAQLKGTSQGESYLSRGSISALMHFFGFDASWPEWSSGTCTTFAQRYNKENTYASRLFACVRVEPSVAPDPQLASLTLRSTKNSPTMPWPLSLDLTCDVSPEQELTLWVRRARIVFKIGRSGVTVPVEQRKRYPGDFAGAPSPSEASIDPISGDQIAIWVLNIRSGVLGSITLSDLLEILDIQPGEDVEVSLRVYVKDLGSNASAGFLAGAPGEKSIRKGETQSIRWLGAPDARISLSAAKAMIAQRLSILETQERDLLPAAEPGQPSNEPKGSDRLYDGWIILARDQLRFLSADKASPSPSFPEPLRGTES